MHTTPASPKTENDTLFPSNFTAPATCWPRSPRAGAQAEVKADYWAIFNLGDDVDPGEAAVAIAQRQAEAFAAKWQRRYPAAVACVTNDLPSLTVHLRFPPEHWRRIRHSNFIERTFGETRRRVKVIGRLPGEASCLSLCGRCWIGPRVAGGA